MTKEIAATLGRGIHLGELTALLARERGDQAAVEDPSPTPGLHAGGVRTYADLEEAVAALAAAHAAAGVAEDDRVMVTVDNRIDVMLHAFAIARLGGVAIPVNHRLRAHEVVAIASAAGAGRLVADDDIDADDDALVVDRTGSQDPSTGIAAWVTEHDERVAAPSPGRDPDAVALMLTTSGTTGVPKAAALTSRGLTSMPALLARLRVGGDERGRGRLHPSMAALPLAHVMGFANVLAALCGGMLTIHRSRFDAAEQLDLIEQRRPRMWNGVPTMYADLEAAGADDRDLSSVRVWGSGADAMPAARARRFARRGAAMTVRGRPVGQATFADSYGMVELSGAAALRLYPPSPRRVRLPALAVVLPGLEARTVTEDGTRARPGRVGELQFRGDIVLDRYEGHPDAGPDDEGWLSSGDYARLWPGGFFSFHGRHGDRLKVGGFSVFPAEVEESLVGHVQVAEVALVGVDDERLGQRPVAVVVPSSDDFDPEAWLAWARTEVAGYRAPQQVVVAEGLPRGKNAKIDRPGATALAISLLEEE